MTKIVTVKVADFGSFREDDEPITIADLAAAIAKIPPEHHATAVLAIEVFGDYASAHVSLDYKRPETDGDRQKRERDETERAARYAREQYQRELAEFTRLKAKFDPK